MRKNIPKIIALGAASVLMLSGCGSSGESEQVNTSEPLHSDISISLNTDERPISTNLFGIFLEDINFAVDAGLYSELIKNRSFEYGSLASNSNKHGWQLTDSDAVEFTIANGESNGASLNSNNPNYAVITNSSDSPEGIFNTGYLDGIAVCGGENYTASLFIRGHADITLSLEDESGSVFASTEFTADSADWFKYTATLSPADDISSNLRFAVRIRQGTVDIDMVSLMPEETFAGLPIRKDIGEYLQALNPSFIRFPGGCVIEGKSEETMYSWKESIGTGAFDFTVNGQPAVGDAAARPQVTDIWSGNNAHPYYCTYGLGFFEYFMLCDALDAMPIPVVNAGMTCEIQSPKYIVYPLSSEKFAQCVQDALDLVEFCRGGKDTKWGAIRIAMGREEPFDLKYLAIGNEQWQSEYYAHYQAFLEAFEAAREKYPELYGDIELIVANGPASGSTEGWNYIDRNPDDFTTLVDEHYYEPPSWFLSNTTRYDSYSRDRDVKVFLGEYAAQSNTMNAALAEAAYMTAIERNGDIIELACYAPLFGNAVLNQWLPDMIFFSNDSVYGTPNYYVQKLFANNAGVSYLNTNVEITGEASGSQLCGRIGLGSWMTSVAYDNLRVVSNESGKTLYENDFDDTDSFQKEFTYHEGEWSVKDGRLVQSNTSSPVDSNTGDAVYAGSTEWDDYTMTVDAEILDGEEGFLIPICVKNTKNNIFWNIGGWGNTVSCLQIVSGGSKSGQVSGTVIPLSLNKGQVYQLKVEVSGSSIRCYIDGTMYVNYTEQTADEVYASTVRDENGDVIIKLVNVCGDTVPVSFNIPGLLEEHSASAMVTVLKADSNSDTNSFSDPQNIYPAESEIKVSDNFGYDAPPYSLTVIRIPADQK